MMTSKKYFIAITIGGIIGAAIALCIAPITLWKVLLGTLTGFAAVYMSYEFREVRRKAPIAWRKATEGLSIRWGRIYNWIKKPHPYLYPTIGIYIILLCIIMPLAIRTNENIIGKITASIIVPIEMAIVSLMIFVLLIEIPSNKGEPSLKYILEGYYNKEVVKKKEKEGYQVLPVTYRNTYRLTWAGYIEAGRKCVETSKKIPPTLKAFARFLLKTICFLIYGWEMPLAKFIGP